MNKTLKLVLWSTIVVAVLAGTVFYLKDIVEERTIVPATEYDDDKNTPGEPSSGVGLNNATALPGDTSGNRMASTTGTASAAGTDNLTVESPTATAGRQLKPSDFHINHKLNARLRFSNFLNTFKDGDYVTGKDLAQVYASDKEINSVVRKLVVAYFEEHIDYIKREQGELIINTVNQQPAVTRIHVPLLIDVNLTINHGSKIVLGKTFIAKEKNFSNVWMLPLNLQGIIIKQDDESIPGKGYVSGDNYYINYSGSTDCYKLK